VWLETCLCVLVALPLAPLGLRVLDGEVEEEGRQAVSTPREESVVARMMRGSKVEVVLGEPLPWVAPVYVIERAVDLIGLVGIALLLLPRTPYETLTPLRSSAILCRWGMG